jgi:hypothetical protein
MDNVPELEFEVNDILEIRFENSDYKYFFIVCRVIGNRIDIYNDDFNLLAVMFFQNGNYVFTEYYVDASLKGLFKELAFGKNALISKNKVYVNKLFNKSYDIRSIKPNEKLVVGDTVKLTGSTRNIIANVTSVDENIGHVLLNYSWIGHEFNFELILAKDGEWKLLSFINENNPNLYLIRDIIANPALVKVSKMLFYKNFKFDLNPKNKPEYLAQLIPINTLKVGDYIEVTFPSQQEGEYFVFVVSKIYDQNNVEIESVLSNKISIGLYSRDEKYYRPSDLTNLTTLSNLSNFKLNKYLNTKDVFDAKLKKLNVTEDVIVSTGQKFDVIFNDKRYHFTVNKVFDKRVIADSDDANFSITLLPSNNGFRLEHEDKWWNILPSNLEKDFIVDLNNKSNKRTIQFINL